MRRIHVAEFKLNMPLRKHLFLLREKRLTTTRAGSPMLITTLADRTGAIPGVFFDVPSHVPGSLQPGRGVEVSGHVGEFRGQLQVNITRIAPAQLLDLEEFLPAARRSIQEMTEELDALMASIRDSHLSRLLTSVFDDAQTFKAFAQAPAAKRNHHACVGGLIEHTLAVAQLVLASCDLYAQLDRDLVLTVALLHDLGKIHTYDPVTFGKTDRGAMWEHVYMSAWQVDRHIEALPGFPSELRLRVVHAILAHQGRLEYGSPVLPMTLEAIVLHNADRLDADAQGFIDQLARPQGEGSSFTERSLMHDTRLYRGREGSSGPGGGQGADL